MEEILRDIASRKFAPLYLLHGEESFFIDKIEAAIEQQVLSEAEKSFNQTIVYGKDTDPMGLLDVLRRYPMMSERQVVILREAQDAKGLDQLIPYFNQPMSSTVFVLCHKHKKLDMTTKVGRALKANAVVFEAKKLYDNQVPDWIGSYTKSHGLSIEAAASQLMAEYLGTDLSKVANEIDKLALNLSKGTSINTRHIEEYVGISKEYNIFELQKALATRDLERVTRIRLYLEGNIRKNPLLMIVSSLFSFFSKVYLLHFLKNSSEAEKLKVLGLKSEWAMREYKTAVGRYSLAHTQYILSVLKEYDLRSKGIGNDSTSNPDELLLKELFWKILNGSPTV
ncbi:MAG: DNA polymerase III subunit delta [Chitinophagales bacterium]|jgi:DNA polymerase-3 subunit delta